MKATSARIRKHALPLSLLMLGLINGVMLSRAYWNNSVPVGWDTPVYIGLTKLTLQEGVYGLVRETHYSHFYTVLSAFIMTAGLSDPFVLEIAFPILLSVFAVMLSGYAMWKWSQDTKMALFAAFFALGWYTLLALVASLHRNLMAFIFLLAVLAYLPSYFEHRRPSLTILFFFLGVLMILTHAETYLVSIGLVIGYGVTLKTITRKTDMTNTLRGVLLYLVPFAVAATVLSPVLPYFLADYMVVLATIRSNLPLIELPLYLGGHLLPLVVLGFASNIMKLRTSSEVKPPLALVLSWASVVLVAVFVLPILGVSYPQWRILVYFPVPFLAALGFDFAIKYMRKRKNVRAPLEYRKPAIAALTLVTIITNFWVATLYADGWMRSYIKGETYEVLRWIEQNYSINQKPILAFYFKAGEYTDGTLALYRNWIDATMGLHYAYYGRLQYLLGGYPMPFQDQEYNRVSKETWNELEPINVSSGKHPILVVEGDFYPRPTAYERSLLYEITRGLFVVNNSFLSSRDLYNIRLMAFRDSYSSSSNWYSAKKYWACESLVAEHFENSAKSEFNMTFTLPVFRAGNYTINVQMLDYASASAPVEILLDNAKMNTISFSGTMRPKTFKLGPFFLQPKLYFLTFRIDDLNKSHQFSLDYVECLLED